MDKFVNLGDCVSGPLWPRETAELLSASEPHGVDVGDDGGDRRKALSASGNTELGRLLD